MATEHDSVELVGADVVFPFVLSALLAALLGASAYVVLPLPISPVPVTLQVLFVFLAGLLLGPYWGAFSMLLYLLAGAMGAPVFAGGYAGLGVIVGETGGYLLSYPLAALLIGLLVHGTAGRRNPAETPVPVLVGALLAATILIYALGVAWLAWVLALEPTEAILVGAVPYVPGEIVKLVAAVAIVRSAALAGLWSR
ncbi:biotin transporter BioY [Natrononativus amylolyticus]|uniref:biotin transporter BioY n=1 Tax=Natrononativus amylolyticus TaxID=2963434 RepID=UPI0020CE9B26|nr:biotin transporter BioY [Natrononativus amylolyticus]